MRFCMLLLLVPMFAVDDIGTRHLREAALHPADLHVSLRVAGEPRSFRVGERIPVVLEFASSSSGKYLLNAAAYDRSGRLPTEEFVAGWKDARDPYAEYFGTGIMSGLGGGLRTNPVLGERPVTIELDLNDWLDFDRAGKYRLFLKSHRLSRMRAPDEPGEGRTVSFAGVSNILEIEIKGRDRVWEKQKLAELRQVLTEVSSSEERWQTAMRELAYLGTPDAVRFAFEHAVKTGQGPDLFLLIAARDRTRMIAVFDEILQRPEVGIETRDIRLRAMFTYLKRDAPEPLPPRWWYALKGAELEKMRGILSKQQERYAEVVRETAIGMIPLLERKSSDAREVLVKAIAELAPNAAKAARLTGPDVREMDRAELIGRFMELPEPAQWSLLTDQWELVKGREMSAVLQQLIAKGDDRSRPAMDRLLEVDKDAANRILRADIVSGRLRFCGFTRCDLAPAEIPEADEALKGLLGTGLLRVMPVIARYGSKRLAPAVREASVRQGMGCMFDSPVVAYFVRAIPEEGALRLRQAMGDRVGRGCYRWLLDEVSAVVWNGVVEAQALATLEDDDAEAATSAARVLERHGSAAVQQALWTRLERWSLKWRGRAEELAGHPITGGGEREESWLGESLFLALGKGRAWTLDEDGRRKLAALCVNDACRDVWK